MNKKRWSAVLIATVLFIVSSVVSIMPTSINENKMGQVMSWVNFFSNKDGLIPTVLEEGNSEDRIAKLTVNGTIQEGTSSGILDSESYNHEEFMEQLKAIEDDENVKGIFLEVNSPGGGVYESAEIVNQLDKIKKKRHTPLYVSMKSIAASGGYYISAKADKIFATDDTVTGSIGVIISSLNYSGLLDKLGIKDVTVKSGILKDMGSSTRPETEQEKEILQSYIDNAYNRFVKIVSEGRNKSEADVKKISDGRIYDGCQAKEVGLVDGLAYPETALQIMRKELDLENAELVEYKRPSSGFISTWIRSKIVEFQGGKSLDMKHIMTLFKNIGTSESPKAMYYYGGD